MICAMNLQGNWGPRRSWEVLGTPRRSLGGPKKSLGGPRKSLGGPRRS